MVSLEDVLATPELARRSSRPADHQGESAAILALTRQLAQSPEGALQAIAAAALNLCRAGSAGVSLLEETTGGAVLRWRAVAGAWATVPSMLTMPRDASPCGAALDRRATLLFAHPDRHYTWLADVRPSMIEGLVTPIQVDGRGVGALWVVAHDERRRFDDEDRRLLEDLVSIAVAAHRLRGSVPKPQGRGDAVLERFEDQIAAFFDTLDVDAPETPLDVAALKHAAERVRRHADDFEDLIDALPAPIYTTDTDGRLTHFNSAAITFSGRVPELGTDQWSVIWKLYGADGTPLPHADSPMTRALRGESVPRGEAFIAERPDGTRRWFVPYPSVLRDGAGRIVGGMNLLLDVTERRRAEEVSARLAAIVESSDDAIISKDLRGIIATWNDGAQRLFGYTAEEAIGKPITLIIPPELHGEERTILERLRRGERIDHFDTRRVRKDGTTILVSLTVSPVKDSAGRVIGASKTARDITERKRMEEALRVADRRKSEFLAMLAHELRNPLAPIRNALQLLRLTLGDEPSQWMPIEVLDRQVTHVARLVDDLLDLNRINQGRIELRRQVVELAPVIQDAVDAIRPLCEEMGHELELALASAGTRVNADPVRLTQVAGNLLSNACKFTDPGGRIRVTVERDGSEALIRVEDSGIGLSSEHLPRIFEMFGQVDTSLERTRGGLGIGLTLVKYLVEAHGGTVEARSAGAGRGSEFVVRLPIFVGGGPAPVAEPSVVEGRGLGLRRVLVVDDNRDAAVTLAKVLELKGHEVYTAQDGFEALKTVASVQPDVVLLDIGLPRMNGYDVARRIRDEHGDTGIFLVAVTGWGQPEDRRRAEDAGFNAHMVKPVNYGALAKLLLSVPARPRSSGRRA